LSQFQAFDKNGDGVLTKEEIYEGYKKLYGEAITEAEVVNKKLNFYYIYFLISIYLVIL